MVVPTQGRRAGLRSPGALKRMAGHRLKKQPVKEEAEMWNERGDFVSLFPP